MPSTSTITVVLEDDGRHRQSRLASSAACVSAAGALTLRKAIGLDDPSAAGESVAVHGGTGAREHLVFEQVGIAADAADRLRDVVVEQDAVVDAAGEIDARDGRQR